MFEQAKRELQEAGRSLERMENISEHRPVDVEAYESEWLTFLGSLERVWYKCNSELKNYPRRHVILGRWTSTRKSDPLLSFLSKSRGAREHSQLNVVGRGPVIRGISARGKPARVDEKGMSVPPTFRAGQRGIMIHYDADTVQMKHIEYRGRHYDVPRSHMGSRIHGANPILFAKLGIAFYEAMLADVSAKCSSNSMR